MSSVQFFQMEIDVPEEAWGLVIGKEGRSIKKFRQSAGISLARLLKPSGKFQIRGDSREAVLRIVTSVKRLISRAVPSKSAGYFPQFYRTCFCKSVENPLLPIDRISLENYTGEISYNPENDRQYLCFKSGEETTSVSSSSDDDNLAAAFSRKMSVCTDFLPHWDISAYKSDLLPCFENQDLMRNVKMIVRFGKDLFHGRGCQELLDKGFVSLSSLQQLCRTNVLKRAFSNACSEGAVKNAKLQLEKLDYVKVSFRMKISIHVVDRGEQLLQRFNISVRCIGEQGTVHNAEVQRILTANNYFQVLDVDFEASAEDVQKAYRRCLLKIEFHSGDLAAAEKAKQSAKKASDCLIDAVQREKYVKNFYSPCQSNPLVALSLSPVKAEISRVRKEPRRHGFISFCREGKDATDFRLGVMSHGREMEKQEDMVKWVDDAWANRTPDQRLVFNTTSRYEVTNIRYKEAETYMTEDFKFRIANVSEMEGETERKRRECALTSRWSKWNDGIAENMDSMVTNDVVNLVKEAFKFSQLMTPR